MDKIIKSCSLKLEEKEKEINELKEKEIFLNKKIKTLEKTNFVNISNTIYNNNKSEAFSLINSNNKINKDMSGESYKKYPIKIIKRNKNSSNDLSSFNNNINKKKNNNHSSTAISTINLNQSESNIFKKTVKLNSNKNNTLDENIKICLKKNARKNLNNNSRNTFRKNSYIKIAKVSTNITNHNYNAQKNNILINLNSINMEKKIIQQKLQKYLKIINTKINNLKDKNYRKMGIYKQSKSFHNRNASSDRNDSIKNSEGKNKKLVKSSLINSTLFEKFDITNRNFTKIPIHIMKKPKKK